MLLSFVIHILVSTVLMGIAFTAALVMDYKTAQDLLIALAAGILLSIPISYSITKRLRNLK
jgi:hypothetical protein